jgi:hypothetical protein
MTDDEVLTMVVTSLPVWTQWSSVPDSVESHIWVKVPDPKPEEATFQWPVHVPKGENVQPFIDSYTKHQTVQVPRSWLGHATLRDDNSS